MLDKAGGGPLYIYALIGCILFLQLHTCDADPSITIIYLFSITFSFVWTPLSPIYAVGYQHTKYTWIRQVANPIIYFLCFCYHLTHLGPRI